MRQKHLWNFLTLPYLSCVGPSLWGEKFPSPCHFPLTPCLDHVIGQSTGEGVQIYLAGSSMFNVGMKKTTILQTKSDSFGGSLPAWRLLVLQKKKTLFVHISSLLFLPKYFSVNNLNCGKTPRPYLDHTVVDWQPKGWNHIHICHPLDNLLI